MPIFHQRKERKDREFGSGRRKVARGATQKEIRRFLKAHQNLSAKKIFGGKSTKKDSKENFRKKERSLNAKEAEKSADEDLHPNQSQTQNHDAVETPKLGNNGEVF